MPKTICDELEPQISQARQAVSRPLVLCIGSFVTKNFGDQAILRIIKQCITAEMDIEVESFPIKAAQVTQKGRRMSWFQKALRGVTWLPAHYVRLWRTVRRAKAVSIGGGHLIHDRKPLTVVQFLLTCLGIRVASRAFLIVTVGAGPIRRRWARLATGIACSMSAGVIARDSVSYAALESCFRSAEWLRPYLVPDPAFLLGGVVPPKTRKSCSWSRIGICVMFYMKPDDYGGGRDDEYRNYLSRMEKIVRLLIERTNAEVIVFSTVPWEDAETVNEFLSRFEGDDRVNGAKIDSVDEALQVTGSFDVLISTRLHPLIFALAQSVPSVAVTDQERIIGLYSDLEARDLLFDISKFNPEDVVAALDRFRQGRGQQLLERVRQHQLKALAGLREIAAEIRVMCHVQRSSEEPSSSNKPVPR